MGGWGGLTLGFKEVFELYPEPVEFGYKRFMEGEEALFQEMELLV